MDLTFNKYQKTLRQFNYTPHWDLPRWGNAVAGEVAELAQVLILCNTIKKIDRDGVTPELMLQLGEEIADVIAYVTHLANKAEIDVEFVCTRKFNKVSQKQGSSIRLT